MAGSLSKKCATFACRCSTPRKPLKSSYGDSRTLDENLMGFEVLKAREGC